MAFEAADDTETPTHTTVARYQVNRLGAVPFITVSYAETVEDGLSAFGAVAQRQTVPGRAWDLRFDADTPDKVQAMGQMLVGIMMTIGRTLLTGLSIDAETVDDATLLAAVLAMDNVDSFIASALERLEQDRRIGQGPELWVFGPAPAVHIPPP